MLRLAIRSTCVPNLKYVQQKCKIWVVWGVRGRPSAILDFLDWFFEQLVSSWVLVCVIMQNFVKIGQTISEILRFFDFQDGGRPSSWILKNNFLNIPWGIVGKCAPACQLSSNSVKQMLRYSLTIYLFFSRWRPSAILDLWGKFWDDPQWVFGGLHHCAEFI